MNAKRAKILKLLVLAGLLAGLTFAWFQRWEIHDSIRLRGYAPPAKVVQLATDTTMNDKTRRLFYAYHPELNAKQAFNANCSSSEKTIVLGCYVDGRGIYLYDVTDERLAGVLQVTTAHEMLHAAYGRLNESDKTKVDAMIEATYKNVTDERIRATIEDYKKNGADTINELHSILGSEVRNLPADLEAYYTRYFLKRSTVVGYSERYEKVFTDRKNQVTAFDKQLDDLKNEIDASNANLESRSKSLADQRNRLNSLLTAKNYTDYNAGVGGYNASVNGYNIQVRTTRALIDKYNGVVASRNEVVTEEGELTKAIDSRPNTIDAQ